MTDKSKVVDGLPIAQWEAMFRPGIPEFAASTFSFSPEAEGQIRLAFGNRGPYIAEDQRVPVYTHAVTLSPATAVELARLLLKFYAQPADDPKQPVAKF